MQNPAKPSRIGPLLLALLGAALLLLPFFAAASPVTKEFRKEVAPKAGALVVLENLAGKVVVEGKAEGPVEIVATIHAGSAELLEQLPIEVKESGARIEVTALYPVDRHDVYRYAGEGHGGSTSTTYRGRSVKVVGSGSSRGVELWADFVLRLPSPVGVELSDAVGTVAVRNVGGPVTARSGSADIRIDGGDGPATARTGSGNVRLADRKGAVEARTGSGDVSASGLGGGVTVNTGSGEVLLDGVTGSVDAHTGSGSVTVRRQEGERVRVRTGSGDITLDGARGSLELDTGSGDVRGTSVTAAGSLAADTGSGDVELAGDFAGLTEARIGSGSGDVSLTMAKAPGMKLDLSTTSGSTRIDLPGTSLKNGGKRVEMTVGDGAARVKVRTSSGNIRIAGR